MLSLDNIEQMRVKDFTEQAYLDYAMYVILDRALPNIGDGLKPVQRRIIYAMSELNLSSQAKFKKSARTIGDVLGKFHPHGDSACYEAMVLMAQSFSYRYPLIEGQGNWGSLDDPKSFAAMRYTEARLSPYATVLLQELSSSTAEWIKNFDGTLNEPKILPAQIPNILLNGTTGIAVGMATDIPPHNSTEVVNACLHLLENPKATTKELFKFIKGPDYPTEAEIITPRQDILKAYQTGQGSIRMRAVYRTEGNDIIITALPHLVSGAKVLEQIAQQMQSKKLTLISDLRDESDHENPMRLVISPRSGRVDTDSLMAHLFSTTDLERTYKVNLNMIGLDGKPKVRNLAAIINEWLIFRTDVVVKRLTSELAKVTARLHILDGYLIAFLNIDEVIHIIRQSDKPKPKLMKKFNLTEQQADAILELKLRHLAKLEEMKINAEQKDLDKRRDQLDKTLNSKQRLKTLIKKELTAVLKQFGDDRRSPIVQREEAKVLPSINKIPDDPITVVLSAKGWVRAGKGHEIALDTLSYKSGDNYQAHALGKNDETVAFLDSYGRAYSIAAHTLPSLRGYGEPLTSRITPEPGATFVSALMADEQQLFLMYSSAGYGFQVAFTDLLGKNRKGKAILNLSKHAGMMPPVPIDPKLDINHAYVIVATKDGYLSVFPLADLPLMSKGKGRKMIHILPKRLANNESCVIQAAIIDKKSAAHIGHGTAKKKLVLEFQALQGYMNDMGDKGTKLPKKYAKLHSLEVFQITK